MNWERIVLHFIWALTLVAAIAIVIKPLPATVKTAAELMGEFRLMRSQDSVDNKEMHEYQTKHRQ